MGSAAVRRSRQGSMGATRSHGGGVWRGDADARGEEEVDDVEQEATRRCGAFFFCPLPPKCSATSVAFAPEPLVSTFRA